jgi:type I restriction enzyme S subunit
MITAPPGWTIRKLADVCFAISKIDPTETGRPTVRYVDISSVTGQRIQGPPTVNSAEAPGRCRQVMKAGDTLFSTVRPYLMKIALVGENLSGEFASTGFSVLRVDRQVVDHRYLHYFALSSHLLGQVLPMQRGVSYPAVTDRQVRQTSIWFPCLEQQRRIVDILEDHLSRLDAAEAGLAAAGKRLGTMWMSTLAHHTSSGRGLRLSDCLAYSIGGVWGEPAGAGEVDVRVLRVTELDRRGELDPKTAAARSVKRSQLASRSLRVGDLLLEKSGGGPTTPVGRVGLVRRPTEPSVCSNFMQLMRPDPAVVLPEYLHAALMAFYVTGKTESLQKASTNIRNLRMPDYLATTVRVPDLADQRARVAELARAREFSDGLARSVDRGRRRLAQLRRGLLEAAFTGRLVSHRSDVGIIESQELTAEAPLSGP